jgi:hypothetical protein
MCTVVLMRISRIPRGAPKIKDAARYLGHVPVASVRDLVKAGVMGIPLRHHSGGETRLPSS